MAGNTDIESLALQRIHSDNFHRWERDQWRIRLQMARRWADAVNRHGGDVTVVYLPELGNRGNPHFSFSDLNNLEVADQLSAWLKEKNLD